MSKDCKSGQEIRIFAVGLGLFQDPGIRIFVSWSKEGLWVLLSLCPQSFICNFIILAQIIFGAAFQCTKKNKKRRIFFPHQPRGGSIPCLSGCEKTRPRFPQSPQAPPEPGFPPAKMDKITAVSGPWSLNCMS